MLPLDGESRIAGPIVDVTVSPSGASDVTSDVDGSRCPGRWSKVLRPWHGVRCRKGESRDRTDARGWLRRGTGADGSAIELVAGAIAAGGGCVARAEDGRVVFVRHALPGERVVARVTAMTSSFLRADAVEVLEPSPDRVPVPCPHAGPGRCGGCDWQHVTLPAQRASKPAWSPSNCSRLAGSIARGGRGGSPGPRRTGMADPGQVRGRRIGRTGLRRHRSQSIEPVTSVPDRHRRGQSGRRRLGAVEGGAPHRGHRLAGWRVAGGVGRDRTQATGRPSVVDAGLVVNGRTAPAARPGPGSRSSATGSRSAPGVFWQVHPGAASAPHSRVLDGVAPAAGERVADLYCRGRPVHRAPGPGRRPRGSVVAVERSGRACSDPCATPAASTRSRSSGRMSPNRLWPAGSERRT